MLEYEDYRWFMAEYRRRLSRRCREGLSVAARRMDRERVEKRHRPASPHLDRCRPRHTGRGDATAVSKDEETAMLADLRAKFGRRMRVLVVDDEEAVGAHG